MSFRAIDAQDPAVRVLERALREDRVGQAYLFAGPSGVGKRSTALALARAAICPERPGEGCDACETCRRIDEGKHPDVRLFGPRDEGDRNLQVDYLRSEVLPFAKFAPFEGKAAFVIFAQADVCFPIAHPEAANALLKTLEEPRACVHFLLLSERPERLLPTIRSRCQRLRFARLPGPVLHAILARHAVPEELRRPAVALAAGRADRALELCQDGRARRMLDWALEVDAAVQRRDPAELLALAEGVANDEERGLLLESLCSFYRDRAAHALGLDPDALGFGSEIAAVAGPPLAPRSAAERVARIQQAIEDFERNANPEIALDGLLFGLHRA